MNTYTNPTNPTSTNSLHTHLTPELAVELLRQTENEIEALTIQREELKTFLRNETLSSPSTTTKTDPKNPDKETLTLMVGAVKCQLTRSTSTRIDTSRLKAERPDLAELYSVLVPTERFTVSLPSATKRATRTTEGV